MKKETGRFVLVTTDKNRKGVFAGYLVDFDWDKKIVTLKNARMAIYWSTETRGVLGLAGIGPQKGSRISPEIPQIELDGVTSISDISDIAKKQWDKDLWN